VDITTNPVSVEQARKLFFSDGTTPKGLVQDAVWRSWQRCAERGRDANEAIEFNHVQRSDVIEAVERNRQLIVASEPAMIRLAGAISGAGYGILMTDRDGCCVAVNGPIDSCGKMLRQALRPGVDLSEAAVATNAMATAMAEGRPIGILGPEHFFSQNQSFQCVAAPIYAPDGALAGSIDITRDTAAPQFGALSLIRDCAAAIETALFLQTPAHISVALSWSMDASAWFAPAILAFGADGEVNAASRSAHEFFGRGTQLAHMRFQDLFHGVYERFIDDAIAAPHYFPLTLQSGLRVFARTLMVRRKQVSAARAAKPDDIGKRTALAQFGDAGIHAALEKATRALAAGLPILLQGETGTGKEVAARALHAVSTGGRGNFVAINCGAIPRDLIEGELFGYADGAYTGARRGGARGKIEEAHGGTLFLDEIGDMPYDMQTRLLRVLESREVTRLGESSPRKLDFQLISATHQDLDDMVRENTFRSDLYFRLHGLRLCIPPLRQRTDLSALIDVLLRDEGIVDERCGWNLRAALVAYDWPGNTRELRHALRFAKAMASADEPIALEHLPDAVRLAKRRPTSLPDESGGEQKGRQPTSLKALEIEVMHRALAQCNGNITLAAHQLGISRSTLHRRLSVRRPDFLPAQAASHTTTRP
jgi:transcriptional regulator of acetoin/glycerol metabolism